MGTENKELLRKEIHECVLRLSEHCDSVRIFCTVHNPDGEDNRTVAIDEGSGNLLAQLGQVSEWMDIQRQYHRNYAIRQDLPSDDSNAE